jgi:hypothetical protein
VTLVDHATAERRTGDEDDQGTIPSGIYDASTRRPRISRSEQSILAGRALAALMPLPPGDASLNLLSISEHALARLG